MSTKVLETISGSALCLSAWIDSCFDELNVSIDLDSLQTSPILTQRHRTEQHSVSEDV